MSKLVISYKLPQWGNRGWSLFFQDKDKGQFWTVFLNRLRLGLMLSAIFPLMQ